LKKNDIENRIVVTENPPIPADSSASGCRKMAKLQSRHSAGESPKGRLKAAAGKNARLHYNA
jgi:hypothetical protein